MTTPRDSLRSSVRYIAVSIAHAGLDRRCATRAGVRAGPAPCPDSRSRGGRRSSMRRLRRRTRPMPRAARS